MHFLPWNYILLLIWTHDFCRLHFCLVCVFWDGKEIFKLFEAAADCKVTKADGGLVHTQSCKSFKYIAHNFLVPALLGSRVSLGMSSWYVNSWVWCFFCLQRQWDSPLLRWGEWYGLPQGHHSPDFIVVFPSCSFRILYFLYPIKRAAL